MIALVFWATVINYLDRQVITDRREDGMIPERIGGAEEWSAGFERQALGPGGFIVTTPRALALARCETVVNKVSGP